MIFFVLSLMLFILPASVIAKTYDVEVTGEYVMGDSDTKLEARRIALEHAKRLAAERIGTYLESETTVKDGRLTKDEIRTYTSAIIKTTILSEGISLLEDKTTVFKLRIKADVDTDVLERKIKEIQSDSKRKDQIASLQAENIKLLKELESLSSQLKTEKNIEYKKLREQRENLFEKLDRNQNSIKVAFERGTLLNLALQSKSELEDSIKNIDDALQFIADNTKFTVGEPKVRHRGDKSDLIINVSWRNTNIQGVLNKIALFYTPPDYLSLKIDRDWFLFYSRYFKGVNEYELSKYFHKRKIVLRIQAGKWGTSHNIKYGWSIYIEKTNYELTISSILTDKLSEITSIDAKVVVE